MIIMSKLLNQEINLEEYVVWKNTSWSETRNQPCVLSRMLVRETLNVFFTERDLDE